jgi:dihydroorotate dehydrogenase
MAEEVLSDFYRLTEGRVPLVGTGGIYDGRTLFRRILLGASVCRAYTALVFEGPDFVKRTLKEIVGHLKRNGFKSVSDAVGQAKSIQALARFGV